MVLVLLFGIHWGALHAIRQRTKTLLTRINEINYAPESDTDQYGILRDHYIAAVASSGVLSFVLLSLMLFASRFQ